MMLLFENMRDNVFGLIIGLLFIAGGFCLKAIDRRRKQLGRHK